MGALIGVYGGTFDPVHLGHLAVAEEVREAAHLDRIVFVPNRAQPLKAAGPWASPQQRLHMLTAATRGNPWFTVEPFEVVREGPSFTVDTLDALQRKWPCARLRFILGTDAANGLPGWRDPYRIMHLFCPIVMSRAGWASLDWASLATVHRDPMRYMELVSVPDLAIASSDIRARVAVGRSIRYLVPESVRAFIEAEGLYRGDTVS